MTILDIDGRNFRTLATDGDVQLGGTASTNVWSIIWPRNSSTQGHRSSQRSLRRGEFWIDVQEAKHALSERQKTTVVCVHAGIRMRLDITRAEFEELTRDLLERTETTTQLLLRQAQDRLGRSGSGPARGRIEPHAHGLGHAGAG